MSATPSEPGPADVARDRAPLLERAFAIEAVESDVRVAGIEGEIPAWVRGSYYLNGPCRFGRGDVRYRHWLDGDGMVSALHFDGGDVRFVNRFVRGAKFVDEEERGAAVYRTFGTGFPGDALKRGIGLESPVNVSAYRWGEPLLAFGEQGLPWELDPITLETRGEHTFGGRLNAVSPLSAHPCIDPVSDEMLNFGISFAARNPCLHLYRFAPDGDLVYRRRLPIPYPCSTHDFILSDRFWIFYLSPYLLDVGRLIGDGATVMEALDWQPERGSRLAIAARDDGSPVAEIEVGGAFCLHLINAFEDDDHLVVDVVELERPIYDQYQPLPELFVDAPPGRPVRRVIDTATWQVVAELALDYPVAPDFPAVDPRRLQRPYEHFWLLGISETGRPGRKFFDQVAHVRWGEARPSDVWDAPPRCYLGGEPVLVPDPESEEHGVVICQQFDAELRASSFLVFDAHRVADGPIARLPVPHPMPLCFHASFHAEPGHAEGGG